MHSTGSLSILSWLAAALARADRCGGRRGRASRSGNCARTAIQVFVGVAAAAGVGRHNCRPLWPAAWPSGFRPFKAGHGT